jgi:hypothetical protein
MRSAASFVFLQAVYRSGGRAHTVHLRDTAGVQGCWQPCLVLTMVTGIRPACAQDGRLLAVRCTARAMVDVDM